VTEPEATTFRFHPSEATMSEIFSGEWSVKVLDKMALFDQRFTISGSDNNSDGPHPGVLGSPDVSVTGKRWVLTMEWNDNERSGWQPSQSRRSGTYTIKEGLMIQLGAKDNWPRRGDGDRDFNNLVLACKFVDPTLNPKPPDNPYDFTIGDSDLQRRP
jgi:hypothetical protein